MTGPAEPNNPGSAVAVARGCKCPVIDNHYGRGFMGGGIKDETDGGTLFVRSADCPLHPLLQHEAKA